MGKGRPRFCLTCRGDDDELMYCKQCESPYHCECVNLKYPDPNFICSDCIEDNENGVKEEAEDGEDGRVKKRAKKVLNPTFKKRDEWLSFILKNRVDFLTEQRASLEPFCSKTKLDSLIKRTQKKQNCF
jgi:hypothetical protein